MTNNICDFNLKNNIAIFASGLSILKFSFKKIHKIKKEATTIFLNYAPCYFTKNEMDYFFWSDKKVSRWLDHYKIKKECSWITRKLSFVNKEPKNIYDKVDYLFDSNLRGNYTIIYLLQLLQKNFPNKKILLFGIDMYYNGENVKWYDKIIKEKYNDWDRKGKKVSSFNKKLEQCADQFKYIKNKNIFNCNMNSNLTYFPKKRWSNIIQE